MTNLIERLRLTDPEDKTVSGILQEAADEIERLRSMMDVTLDGLKLSCRDGADEIERLQRLVGDMLHAQHRQEGRLVVQENEIKKLRGAIRSWSDARQAMMAGSAEGKPWSASSIGALGFAEALLVAALEDSR